ncbi:MAG: DNA repair protein RecO C-terminal domain-containing protein [Candidatus Competibacteraceae bacterium]|nr:DNA repair protein RecO C-terminal domain-containing protein [Candidatus Competibacteraceae bacterium]
MQPFAPLLLSWSGAGGAGDADGRRGGASTPLPAERVRAGLYANELLVRLLPRHDPPPGSFLAYKTLLSELVTAPDAEPSVTAFREDAAARAGLRS